MNIMDRIDTLFSCGFSTESDYDDLCRIVDVFDKRCGIELTEENAGIMITHMASAFRRNRTDETVEPLDAKVFAEAMSSEAFPLAESIVDEIIGSISNAVSENEKEFFLIHICSLLEEES